IQSERRAIISRQRPLVTDGVGVPRLPRAHAQRAISRLPRRQRPYTGQRKPESRAADRSGGRRAFFQRTLLRWRHVLLGGDKPAGGERYAVGHALTDQASAQEPGTDAGG